MGKVWKYTTISAGLIIFLHFAGVPVGAVSQILNLIGIEVGPSGEVIASSLTNSSFYNFIFGIGGILTSIVAVGSVVIAGFFTKAKPENLIMLPIVPMLLVFLSAGVSIISHTISLGSTWVTALVVLLLAPWTIGYIIALAEWFRGTD